MNQNEFIGMTLSALAVIVSFIIMVTKCFKPMCDLNINIVKLTDAIENLIKNDRKQDENLKTHEKQINDLTIRSKEHELRITHLEEKE